MYPQLILNMSTLGELENELGAINDALRIAVLALEVERSNAGTPGQWVDDDLQAILGLGVLLNDLQVQRNRAIKLTRALPSPNKLPAKLSARAAALGSGLFEALNNIRNIQREVYKMARLNLKSAAVKMVSPKMQTEDAE